MKIQYVRKVDTKTLNSCVVNNKHAGFPVRGRPANLWGTHPHVNKRRCGWMLAYADGCGLCRRIQTIVSVCRCYKEVYKLSAETRFECGVKYKQQLLEIASIDELQPDLSAGIVLESQHLFCR